MSRPYEDLNLAGLWGIFRLGKSHEKTLLAMKEELGRREGAEAWEFAATIDVELGKLRTATPANATTGTSRTSNSADSRDPNLPQAQAAKQKVNELRQRLLDLSNRNRLINFKHTARGGRQIRIVDEFLPNLYATLEEDKSVELVSLPPLPEEPDDESDPEFLDAYEEGLLTDKTYLRAIEKIESDAGDDSELKLTKARRALKDRIRKKLGRIARTEALEQSIQEHAARFGIDASYSLDHSNAERRRKTTHWQTLLSEDELSRRLKSIEQQARESREEYGIETLYLVLGFLEWHESTPDGQGESMLLSPLILRPIGIEKKQILRQRRTANNQLMLVDSDTEVSRPGRDTWVIKAGSDEVAINICLRERLRDERQIALPDWEEDSSVEAYLAQVERAISQLPHWKVRRYSTLTHLSFNRLAMWLDLDTSTNSTSPPHLVPVLRELFGGRDETNADEPVDMKEKDDESGVPALVMDCDSSQFSAIRSALRGENLVIQGPPGTGKSQTISNLIAGALYQGKTVLFVAEKMAALEVVHKRLTDVGLGNFLLELHSSKSGKKPVLDSIRKRLSYHLPELENSSDSAITEKRRDVRDLLNNYTNAINSLFGESGWTNHDIFWKKFGYHGRKPPVSLGAYGFKDVASWNQDAIKLRRQILGEWCELFSRHSNESKLGGHPWLWVEATDLHVSGCEQLLSAARSTFGILVFIVDWVAQRNLIAAHASLKDLSELPNAILSLGRRPEETKEGLWKLALAADGIQRAKLVVAAIDRLKKANKDLSDKVPGFAGNEKAALEWMRDLTSGLRELDKQHETLYPNVIDQRLADTLQLIEDLGAAASLVSRLSNVLRFPDSPIGANELSFSVFTMLAAKAPSGIVLAQHGLDRDGATSLVRERILTLKGLKLRIAAISNLLILPFGTISLEEVVTASSELDRDGILAWFRSGYRKARVTVTKIAPSVKRSERGAFLRETIELISELKKVTDDSAFRMAAGELFRGLETDFAAIEAACSWVDEVKQATPIIGPYSSELRTALFSLGSDLKTSAVLLAEQHWIPRLNNLAQRCREYNLRLDKVEANLKSEATTLHEITRALGLLQWIGEISPPWFARLNTALREKASSQQILDDNSEVQALLLPDLDRSFNCLCEISSALERADNLPIPETWRSKLRSESSPGSWSELGMLGQELRGLQTDAQSSVNLLAELGGTSAGTIARWERNPIASLQVDLQTSIVSETTLTTRAHFLAIDAKLHHHDLKEFVDRTKESIGDFASMEELFDFTLLRSMCNQVFGAYPCLKEYRNSSPGVVSKKFRELDSRLKDYDRTMVVQRLLQRRPPAGIGYGLIKNRTENSLLEYVTSLERPRTTVRDLVRRAGLALQALKPCFMMSPLSVAQLIERGKLTFDLVIFDEASQVKPEDALSALSRARQYVVVGDKMQLPPTVFGDKSAPEEIYDDEESSQLDESAAVESILESVEAATRRTERLLWHYRSRDPSLIAFSNKEFYENTLQLFPAPRLTHPSSGVKYVWVQGTYSARTNLEEARCCAKAAVEFMHCYPNRSLGIVALNRPQADLIELELEKLIHETEEAQEYRAKWSDGLEPLFVKNLENVQGDERDVIFISTVFGYDDGGRFYQRFGPINSKVGHRRLNVLFTRAKHQLVLFTSIPIDKVQATETSNWGVRALKQYLEYARSGRLEVGQRSGRSEDSPFEVSVRRELATLGFQCEPQVGVAGFFIDLAVRHPNFPDHFILGIECDGAAYHRTQSARDRD